MKTVSIELGPRTYPILIGKGLRHQTALYKQLIHGGRALIVTNDIVAPLYLSSVEQALADWNPETLIVPDGEGEKNVNRWSDVIDSLTAMGATRDVTLVALGGGVIGDLTGFAAASYMRGVDFVQLPTSLLAQVDASVGGKTAINHPAGKNLIGAFHQPQGVVIDLDTLDTLPGREFRAGLAEVVKYGLLGDATFLPWLAKHRSAILDREPGPLGQMIARCCEQKAAIVAADEREQGQRALLNLGHTFGHAIEAESGYGHILHGEAVAIGCCLAASLSAELGYITEREAGEVTSLIAEFGLPTQVPKDLQAERLISRMGLDKKNRDGQLRLVLLRAIGAAAVDTTASNDQLLSLLQYSAQQ